MTRVGIIETGRPTLQQLDKFGNYPGMFINLLAGQPNMEFTIYSVLDKNLPATATERDAWIITGSSAGVYDKLSWIPPLAEFVQVAARESVPTLGVCFGHQLLAHAYGGTVVKSDKGRGIGVHNYTLTEAGKKILPEMTAINLIASHQDQVVKPPEEATVLASSDFCPYAVMAYGNYGLSLQPHPEFSPEFERVVIHNWNARDPVSPALNETALQTLDRIPPDAQRIAPILSQFLAGQLSF